MWLETTKCQNILADYGGHFVYDGYLAIVPFFLAHYLPNYGTATSSSI
jgi:hypothetical protein